MVAVVACVNGDEFICRAASESEAVEIYLYLAEVAARLAGLHHQHFLTVEIGQTAAAGAFLGLGVDGIMAVSSDDDVDVARIGGQH